MRADLLGLLPAGTVTDLGYAILGVFVLLWRGIGGGEHSLELDEGTHGVARIRVGLSEVNTVASGGLPLGLGKLNEMVKGGDFALIGMGLMGDGGVKKEHGRVVGMGFDDFVRDGKGFVEAPGAEEDVSLGGHGGSEIGLEGERAVEGVEGFRPMLDFAIIKTKGGPEGGEICAEGLGLIERASGHRELADGDEARCRAGEETGAIFALEQRCGRIEIGFSPWAGAIPAEDEGGVVEPGESEVLGIGEVMEERFVRCGIAGKKEGIELSLVIERPERRGHLHGLSEGALIGDGREVRSGSLNVRE